MDELQQEINSKIKDTNIKFDKISPPTEEELLAQVNANFRLNAVAR
jgi:hypothetical protein